VDFELAAGKDRSPVDMHRMMLSKITFNLLQRLFVPRMNRLVSQ
jgi:hypothetical protein